MKYSYYFGGNMEKACDSNRMKISAMSALWGDVAAGGMLNWMMEVRQAGYDGVSCFVWDLENGYLGKPDDFKKLLDEAGLPLASVVIFGIDANFDNYRQVCEFMSYNNCENLVLLGGNGKKAGDFKALGGLLNYIGGIALSYGIKAVYHNHSGMIGETFGDMDNLLANTDPERVFVMVDTGHATLDFTDYPNTGERAVAFMKKYWDRFSFVELKDFNETTGLATPVGEGYCDHQAVFDFLKEKAYTGWIAVEQNGPSLGRTPLECAKISREFIRIGLGV